MTLTFKKIGTLSIIAASLFAASWGASAANDANSATINFTGTVVASTCTPGWESKGADVNFGEVAAADFGSTKETAAKSQDFTLSLTACDDAVKKVKVTANGTADTDDDAVYKNTAASGATGAGIKLLTGNDVLKNGASHEFAITSKTADMKFTAELVNTTEAAPGNGAVASTVTLNMDYE